MIDLSHYQSSATKTINTFVYTLLIDSKGNAIIERNEGSASINMYCKMATPTNGTETILGSTVVEPATSGEIQTAIQAFWTGSVAGYTYSLLFQIQG